MTAQLSFFNLLSRVADVLEIKGMAGVKPGIDGDLNDAFGGRRKHDQTLFGLILFTYTTKSPGNLVFPLKLVHFPLHGSTL